ncbi:hypothetical protein EDD18DRAFT_1113198 [Armillaria luteobubalina]|uniref:Uncharacterized protein n=1 Tax=Armillaria luteobubalina TaxID=153913 RepID=A0AA39PBZ8_9AGAR|nr:hypothetical protein EDD18DRAFT_1113198 [Armillaria luteobubalina]
MDSAARSRRTNQPTCDQVAVLLLSLPFTTTWPTTTTLHTTDVLFRTQLKRISGMEYVCGGTLGCFREEQEAQEDGRKGERVWTANDNDNERALLGINAGPVDGWNAPNISLLLASLVSRKLTTTIFDTGESNSTTSHTPFSPLAVERLSQPAPNVFAAHKQAMGPIAPDGYHIR